MSRDGEPVKGAIEGRLSMSWRTADEDDNDGAIAVGLTAMVPRANPLKVPTPPSQGREGAQVSSGPDVPPERRIRSPFSRPAFVADSCSPLFTSGSPNLVPPLPPPLPPFHVPLSLSRRHRHRHIAPWSVTLERWRLSPRRASHPALRPLSSRLLWWRRCYRMLHCRDPARRRRRLSVRSTSSLPWAWARRMSSRCFVDFV